MIWKRLRSKGPSAFAELLVVAAGVVLALAVDGWNESRMARIEEVGYLGRLAAELEEDTVYFNFVLESIDKKERSLLSLSAVLKSGDPLPPDSAGFLYDLGQSANFGWNVGPLTRNASYEDLRGSGKLGLISDPSLRLAIVKYYSEAEGEDRRMMARKTGFPLAAYGLVPRQEEYSPALEPGVSEGGIRGLLEKVRRSDLPDHLIAELNRARFIRSSMTSLKRGALELLDLLMAQSGAA